MVGRLQRRAGSGRLVGKKQAMNLPTLGAAVGTSEPTDASVGSRRAPVEKSDRSMKHNSRGNEMLR